MNRRDRFLKTLRYEPVDRRPLYLAGPWHDTLVRWRGEGLPAHVDDVHAYRRYLDLLITTTTDE